MSEERLNTFRTFEKKMKDGSIVVCCESTPLSLWVESDVWRYIDENDIKLSPMYTDGGMNRTGCMFCPVPIAHGDLKNIEYARKHHPKIYAAIMEKHGLKAMLERLGIEQKDQLSLF